MHKVLYQTETSHRHRYPTLPFEVVERIADFVFELQPPITDSEGNAPITCSKPAWVAVKGFMQASVDLHNMGYLRWLRVISVKNPEDWRIISRNMLYVRELICLDCSLLDANGQEILSQLPHLNVAMIDAHSEVQRDDQGQFTFRSMVVALPPSLKRLEITNAHGPDIWVIATVKEHCPQLEELRLGRCTMFNRIPACDFWSSFPYDHDAYMADSGTDAYADFLGHELSTLKNLHTLRMGLYLVSPTIVLAHRLYHTRGRPAPEAINWQTFIPLSELPVGSFIAGLQHVSPTTIGQLVSVLHQRDSEPVMTFDCPQCVEATAETRRVAEMNANAILHEHVPSLTKVEWMAWLTPGHLGVHSHELPSRSDA